MAPRFLLAGVLVVCFAAGCKNHREAYMVEVFNAQNLILEDKIYELSDRIAALESRTTKVTSTTQPGLLDEETTDDDSSAERSDETTPDVEIPDLSPPDVEPGTPTDPEELMPPGLDDEMSSTQNASHIVSPKDADVVEVLIAPETRTAGFDDQPGDDGVWVVLEPKNRQGQTVPTPTKVSIGVRDAETKEQLGEWHFDAGSVSRAVRIVGGKPAIVLQVRWDRTPKNKDLELGVLYYKDSKQHLSVRSPLAARLPGKVADRWTPRPPNSPRRQANATESSKPVHRSSDEDGPGAEVYR